MVAAVTWKRARDAVPTQVTPVQVRVFEAVGNATVPAAEPAATVPRSISANFCRFTAPRIWTVAVAFSVSAKAAVDDIAATAAAPARTIFILFNISLVPYVTNNFVECPTAFFVSYASDVISLCFYGWLTKHPMSFF